MKKKIVYTILSLAFIVGLALPCLAGMVSDNYNIYTSVLSGGGVLMSSGNYLADATLGQSSPLMDPLDPPYSTSYDLYPGFWYTALVPPPPMIPDLVITILTPSNPNPNVGENITMTIVVENQGSGDAGSFSLDFYYNLSTPPIPGQSGDMSHQVTGGLVAGASYTWVTDPFTSTLEETWHSYAQVDTNQEVDESDEANNVYGPVDITWGVMPYVSVSLTPDDTVIPRGGTLGLQATVTNNTNKTGTVYFATKVRLPNGKIYPSSGYLYGPLKFTLGPYKSKSGHLTQNIPPSAPLGTYTYYGYVHLPGKGIVDEDQFDFEVTASPVLDEAEDWETELDEDFAE